MRIFVMRHEDRSSDRTMYGNLSEKGFENASSSVVQKLDKLKINVIYCSPFQRCLQTVKTYSKKHNIHLDVDYRIQETLRSNVLSGYKSSIGRHLDKYTMKSCLFLDVKHPESRIDVETRVSSFMKNILHRHSNSEDNILICTHMGIAQFILNTNLYIPMGKITDLFDGQCKLACIP